MLQQNLLCKWRHYPTVTTLPDLTVSIDTTNTPPSFFLFRKTCWQKTSVADLGCLSRILIFTHPGSRIQKQKNSSKREGWKTICCHTFFSSHKFHIIENYLILEMLKKKIWASFQSIIELFTQKIGVTKLSKILVYGSRIQDPRSGIRKKATDPGSRSTTLQKTNIF